MEENIIIILGVIIATIVGYIFRETMKENIIIILGVIIATIVGYIFREYSHITWLTGIIFGFLIRSLLN